MQVCFVCVCTCKLTKAGRVLKCVATRDNRVRQDHMSELQVTNTSNKPLREMERSRALSRQTILTCASN